MSLIDTEHIDTNEQKRPQGSSGVSTRSRGFLRGWGSKKVPLLSEGLPVLLAELWVGGSLEMLSSSVTRSPSSWISRLLPSKAADRGGAEGSWGGGGGWG